MLINSRNIKLRNNERKASLPTFSRGVSIVFMMSFFGGRRQSQSEAPAETTPTKTVAPVAHKTVTPASQTPRQPVGFETVLGANSTLRGDLKSQANVRLDGTFDGNLEIEGNVLVGETGKINADIHARNVVIAGAVRGNVSGNRVQLLRTSRVWGDIHAAAITTEEGAFIDGKITMVRHDASRQSFESDDLFGLSDEVLPTPPAKLPSSSLEDETNEESIQDL
jgi:cytoskeletal protein CcmA (bactofilin family)